MTVRLVRSSLPAAFALLASVVEVEMEGCSVKFSRSWVAADPAGGALLIGSDSSVSAVDVGGILPPLAVRLAGEFSGRKEGAHGWQIKKLPEMWEEMGKVVSILYESDKLNGGGTGKKELFRHDFSPGAMAYGAGEFLVIVGPKIKVDASGVRN